MGPSHLRECCDPHDYVRLIGRHQLQVLNLYPFLGSPLPRESRFSCSCDFRFQQQVILDVLGMPKAVAILSVVLRGPPISTVKFNDLMNSPGGSTNLVAAL